MDEREHSGDDGGGSMMPWFWVGGLAGLLFSAAAVVFATEFTRRRGKPSRAEYLQNEMDLVEDLSHAVTAGLDALADAVKSTDHDFGSVSRERIRYGLDPGHAGAGAHGWYTGDEEDH